MHILFFIFLFFISTVAFSEEAQRFLQKRQIPQAQPSFSSSNGPFAVAGNPNPSLYGMFGSPYMAGSNPAAYGPYSAQNAALNGGFGGFGGMNGFGGFPISGMGSFEPGMGNGLELGGLGAGLGTNPALYGSYGAYPGGGLGLGAGMNGFPYGGMSGLDYPNAGLSGGMYGAGGMASPLGYGNLGYGVGPGYSHGSSGGSNSAYSSGYNNNYGTNYETVGK